MSFLEYQISADVGGNSVCLPDLQTEVIAAGPYAANFGGVEVTGDWVKLHFDAEPNEADVIALLAVVAAHNHDLAIAKMEKTNSIDARTKELIELGFSFNAKQFSLSLPAQSKLTAAFLLRDEVAFVYPAEWNSLDDLSTQVIADAAEMATFYWTAIGTIRAYLDSDTGFKNAVRSATTVEEVDAVVDNR